MGSIRLRMLLDTERILPSPRMLQTAFFLAQSFSDFPLYHFRVSRGKVISDELDQDLASLQRKGWASLVCSVGDCGAELFIHPRKSEGVQLDDSERKLKEILEELFAEEGDVLEAAATLVYAREHTSTNFVSRLNWLSRMQEDVLERAQELART